MTWKTTLHIIHAVLWLASVACAQVTIPESTPAYHPIEAKIALSVEEGTRATISWSASPGVQFIAVDESAFTLHVWATPGEHWLTPQATIVKVLTYVVLVPDKQDPKNLSKAQEKTITEYIGTETRAYPPKKFRVTPPPKTDDDKQPPDKKPDDKDTDPKDDDTGLFGLAPKTKAKINELVPAEHRSKANELADVFRDLAKDLVNGKITDANAQFEIMKRNGQVLKTAAQRDAWHPFWQWFMTEMIQLESLGLLEDDPKTPNVNERTQAIAQVLAEMSLGMKQAGGGI